MSAGRVRALAGRTRSSLRRRLAISAPKRAALLREASVTRWFADGAQETLRLDFPLETESLVWDVGGYEGDWAAEMRDRYGCRFEVFEPVAHFARELEARFDGDDRIVIHHVGLGGETRRTMIELDADGSSIYGTRRGADEEEIRVVDVMEQLARTDSDIDLAKINIEGAEYELLERLLATGATTRFKRLLVQFHPDVPSAAQRMRSIQRDLGRTHDLLWGYPFVWESWLRKAG